MTADDEIKAYADWAGAIENLVRGKLEDCLNSRDSSENLFKHLGKIHAAATTQISKLYALALIGRYDEAIACGLRAEDYFPYADAANIFHLPSYTASFGFGAAVMVTPKHLALFEFTPRIGFKLGTIEPIFDNDFNVLGFNNVSKPSIGFGYQWNTGKHSFTLTLSNTQTTTTSRSNSSNLVLSPKNVVIGFNLFRRW